MNVIIAEKPSVARELARIVGATTRQDGYIEGNGYTVTWAFGHLITLAMPAVYGIKGFQKEILPIIPSSFTLVPRPTKTEKGYKPDPSAVAQLKVIKRLFANCEKIIVATDAGREGELIFRYIYQYVGCTKPFDRLWISSLTDSAIRKGLDNLQSGTRYDNLYHAARARSEADWLVGINATQAVTIAAGRGTYSLGRVQTPTLAIVCRRYWENRNFISKKFWQLSLGVKHEGEIIKCSSVEKWCDSNEANAVFEALNLHDTATVQSIERKEVVQEAPLLYDLTTLQKEANSKYGFSADKTLSIAQKLYESKLITYPRTGSRYISDDVFAEIPALITSLKSYATFGRYAKAITEFGHRSVDGSKITDHHALLITGAKPIKGLSADETTIYDMVAGRMLEAFLPKCIKDTTTVLVDCGGVDFTLKGSMVRQEGWRSIYGEQCGEQRLPQWNEGEIVSVGGYSLSESLTKAKPLHTEATLLSAMETAGKELEDEHLRLKMKDCGIGTPATRAAVIETLITRGYMARNKKALTPTEKGLAIYSIVKSMRIADIEMTGEWEAALAKVESGKIRSDTFVKGVEIYTTQITEELLKSKILFPNSKNL